MKKTMKMKTCRYCGHENPMENRYCAKCGKAFRNMVPIIEIQKGKDGGKVNVTPIIILALAVVAVIAILLAIILPAKTEPEQTAPCTHNWVVVDCESPRICSECGKTGGDAAGHDWQKATCEKPRTCSVCNATEGTPKDHIWQEATCENPRTCTECDATEGVPKDHIWENATCENPIRCKICGEVSGTALGHDWMDATYSAPKTCERCGAEEGEPLANPLADAIRERLPLVTYAMSSEKKVYGYEDEALTKRSDEYYFNAYTDQIVITDVSADGTALEVRYPSSLTQSGYRTLWFPFEDIISLEEVNIGSGMTTKKTNTYRASKYSGSVERCGYMEPRTEYLILGQHEVGYTAIIYLIYDKVIYGIEVGDKLALVNLHS